MGIDEVEKAVTGKVSDIDILQADHSTRSFGCVITHAEQTGSDGGLSRYAFTLEPATYYCTLQSNSQVFQDLSAQDITDLEFRADYRIELRFKGACQSACTVRP